jgi:hypothetical protein
LSLRTVAIIFLSACSFFSTLNVSALASALTRIDEQTHLSIMFMTFVLIFRPMPFWVASSSRHCSLAWGRLTPWKSYGVPDFPKYLSYQQGPLHPLNRTLTRNPP